MKIEIGQRWNYKTNDDAYNHISEVIRFSDSERFVRHIINITKCANDGYVKLNQIIFDNVCDFILAKFTRNGAGKSGGTFKYLIGQDKEE